MRCGFHIQLVKGGGEQPNRVNRTTLGIKESPTLARAYLALPYTAYLLSCYGNLGFR